MTKIIRKGIVLRVLIVLLSVLMTYTAFLLFPRLKCINDMQDNTDYLTKLTGGITVDPEKLANRQSEPALPELHQMNLLYSQEAEYMTIPDGAIIDTLRRGYHGRGYVTYLPAQTESALSFELTIPFTQHYAISVSAAADCNTVNAVSINGSRVAEFTIDDRENFTLVTMHGIFLEEGTAIVSIDTIDGNIDVDFVQIQNDNPPSQDAFQIQENPCNPYASPEAVALYRTLRSQWGKTTLTGQYASDGTNRELQMIYQQTGQLPAIRFSALTSGSNRETVQDAMEWSINAHGIVGLMWFWNAPGSDSVYAKDTDFQLEDALRGTEPEELALLTPNEADAAVESGVLREDARALLRDIDAAADDLIYLRDLHIPVLWRPLHEAGGGWYWWGSCGSDAYQKLWKLLFYRMTCYHDLNNLIWIWNGQSKSYLVPEKTYDIASADIYIKPGARFGSRYEMFQSLASLTNRRKMLAISECGSLPETGQMQLDQSVWSFCGLWYGDYLIKPDGSFSDLYYSSKDLYILYNSKLTLSLNDFLSICQ